MADKPGASPQQAKKITTPERVQRIMAKLSQAKVHVLIRTTGSKPATIKSVLAKAVSVKGKQPYIVFAGISAAGAKILQLGTTIAVDVIGLKHRLYFETKISTSKDNIFAAAMPPAIIMVERRGAERHTVRSDSMCFIGLQPLLTINQDDHIIMPFFPPYGELAMRFPVADISTGGLCIKTRFEDTMKWLKAESEDVDIALHIPRQAPIVIGARVCWNRTIKQQNEEDRSITYLLVGIQFGKLEDKDLIKVKRYIRDMAIKEAI